LVHGGGKRISDCLLSDWTTFKYSSYTSVGKLVMDLLRRLHVFLYQFSVTRFGFPQIPQNRFIATLACVQGVPRKIPPPLRFVCRWWTSHTATSTPHSCTTRSYCMRWLWTRQSPKGWIIAAASSLPATCAISSSQVRYASGRRFKIFVIGVIVVVVVVVEYAYTRGGEAIKIVGKAKGVWGWNPHLGEGGVLQEVGESSQNL